MSASTDTVFSRGQNSRYLHKFPLSAHIDKCPVKTKKERSEFKAIRGF